MAESSLCRLIDQLTSRSRVVTTFTWLKTTGFLYLGLFGRLCVPEQSTNNCRTQRNQIHGIAKERTYHGNRQLYSMAPSMPSVPRRTFRICLEEFCFFDKKYWMTNHINCYPFSFYEIEDFLVFLAWFIIYEHVVGSHLFILKYPVLEHFCWETVTYSKLWFWKFKRFVSRSVFGETYFTQISFLKSRSLWAKLCVAFLLFYFERNYGVSKSKSQCILLNKNVNFNKSKTKLKMENPTHSFKGMNHVLQLV